MANSALSTNVSGGKLELSLLNLDLLSDAASPTGLAQSAVREIYQWLGREGVSRSEFEFCVKQTASLAFPNENGLALTERILRYRAPNVFAGSLALVLPGAIGRRMAQTLEHSYIVTTTVVLARFQPLSTIPNLFCELVFATDKSKDTNHAVLEGLIRLRLMKVLSKIVDSIALNVVNQGYDVPDFPEELKKQCQRHKTPSAIFARLITELQRPQINLILICERFQADVVLWLLNHFNGNLEIWVQRKRLLIWERSYSRQQIQVLVELQCDVEATQQDPSNSCRYLEPRIDLYERLENGRHTFGPSSRGYTRPKFYDKYHQPARRRPLYDIRWYGRYGSVLLGKKDPYSNELGFNDMASIWIIVKGILKWLMLVPTVKAEEWSRNHRSLDLDITLQPEQQGRGRHIRLGSLFKRWPSIIAGDDGSAPSPPHIRFNAPGAAVTSALCDGSTFEMGARFPDIHEFVEQIIQRCDCTEYEDQDLNGHMKFSECLGVVALNNILVRIGHGIAEAFGVSDASGIVDFDILTSRVLQAFLGLFRGNLDWEAWIYIALITALGTTDPFVYHRNLEGHDEGRDSYNEGGVLLGAQHGCTLALVSWLDMRKELTLNSIFSLDIVEGRITGIESESALITSHPADVKEISGGRYAKWAEAMPVYGEQVADAATVDIQHAVFGTRCTYRVATIATSGEYRRLIDPAAAAINRVRCSPLPQSCAHIQTASDHSSQNAAQPETPDNMKIGIFEFPEALGCWGGSFSDRYADGQFSSNLGTHLQVNLALAVAVSSPCILLRGRTRLCAKCFTALTESISEGQPVKVIICEEPSYLSLVRRR